MGGRTDYEERRKRRIDRYKQVSKETHKRLIKRLNDDIRKSIEPLEKSNYYKVKTKKDENGNAIYNDDPEAIEKLKDKVQKLEKERDFIKSYEHETWELSRINANIRETKIRIQRLENKTKEESENIEQTRDI